MSSGCSDVLSLADLQTAKKHQIFEAEVITGKQGGVASGADIDYATNQVTGQTQKTLPAVLRDAGFRPATFTFATGGTLGVNDSDLAVLWPGPSGDGQYYVWRGAYPKTIPASSTPDGTGGTGVGGWVSVGDVTLRSDLAKDTGSGIVGLGGTNLSKFLKSNRFDYLSSQMASGRTVKIACFGDSTTDGDGTYPHSGNPTDSSGNAVGNSNHNLVSPNTWPVKLQDLLRSMYGNDNIYVYNAGYSGKRMDNGWAYNNYAKAIIDNPYYGPCDGVIIDFGLNDIVGGYDVIDNHIAQTEKLLDLIIDQGSIPILLTSGPEYQDNDAGQSRDNEQISQQINVAKNGIANKYNIMIIDKALALKDYLSNNQDDINWVAAEPDGLHFGNAGHLAQAGYIASCFYKDVVIVNPGGVENISFTDSRSNSPGAPNARYVTPVSKFGATAKLSSNYTQDNLGNNVMKIWVYCKTPTVGMAYITQDADNQSTYSENLNSKIRVTAYPAGELFKASPTNIGPNIAVSQSLRFTDVPTMLCRLSYGLNLVEYLLPTDSSVFTEPGFYFGWFKFADKMPIGRKGVISYSLLRDTGPLSHRHTNQSTTNYIVSRQISDNLSNCVCFPPLNGAYTTMSVSIDLDMAPGLGFMLMGGNKGIQQNAPYFVSEGVMIVRTSPTALALQGVGKFSDNSTACSAVYTTGTIPGGVLSTLYIELVINKSNGSRKIDVYESIEKASLIMTYTINAGEAQRYPAGGYFGDIFVNTSFFTSGTSGTINIKSASAQFK